MDLAKYLEFISETAYQAGRLTLSYFLTGVEPDWKADHSPVTVADRKAEEYIRRQIETRYPTHAIVGEEFGGEAESQGADMRWFIDPIDGTKSFIRGVPLYGTLIGLEVEGQVRVGAAYFPALDELICAASGLGCWWNGRRARVSQVARLEQAVLTTTSVQAFNKYGGREAFDRLAGRCYYQTGWSDAYGYMLVASGRAEVAIDPAMNAWDCGPFPPILTEAGGYFGDWDGRPTIHAGRAMATTNALLEEVLRVLGGG